MALHSLYCADVPLRNCSLSHWQQNELESSLLISSYHNADVLY